jgi:preprotein translocase subunit SecF
VVRSDFVGPQVGTQQRNQGIWAVVLTLVYILIYIAVRFDFFFGPGAIVATLHDIVVILGVFALFQVEFNLTVVGALLTLIGFSLNDTIVVYDRIRENLRRFPQEPLRALVNRSINETLSRTVLTSTTVLMVVTALFLGGPYMFGFALTMFVGVIVGTYSSIAVASPVYILLYEYFSKASAAAREQKVL